MLYNLQKISFLLLLLFVVICFKYNLNVSSQNTQQYSNGLISRKHQDRYNTTNKRSSTSHYVGNQIRPHTPPGFHPQVSSLPPGWCYTEVPTHTLHKNSTYLAPGNGSHPSLSVIPTCCEGYNRRKINNEIACIPTCDRHKCINAFCVGPNKCQCFPDHVEGLGGDCFPTCPIACVNGKCSFDGLCKCNDGFVFDESRKFCRPYCSESCGEFQNCSDPGVCTCMKGYAMDDNDICRPVCTKNCHNGMCVAPETCSCYTGFFLKDSICQATCWQNCTNGICVASDTCVCDPGYVAHMDSCIPYCTDCENGTCIGPENCSYVCNAGYKKVNRKCKPHCRQGCKHGACVAPDLCDCNVGYEKNSLGRCVKRKPDIAQKK